MFTISLVGQKGGTGKTAAALGLAVAGTRAGHAVVLIDLDPQATATKWKDRRTEDNPVVVPGQASRLNLIMDASRNAKMDFAIIDTAGRNDDSALAAARAADLVLIPCRPNMVEIETLCRRRRPVAPRRQPARLRALERHPPDRHQAGRRSPRDGAPGVRPGECAGASVPPQRLCRGPYDRQSAA